MVWEDNKASSMHSWRIHSAVVMRTRSVLAESSKATRRRHGFPRCWLLDNLATMNWVAMLSQSFVRSTTLLRIGLQERGSVMRCRIWKIERAGMEQSTNWTTQIRDADDVECFLVHRTLDRRNSLTVVVVEDIVVYRVSYLRSERSFASFKQAFGFSKAFVLCLARLRDS